jgi:hypothetical protein
MSHSFWHIPTLCSTLISAYESTLTHEAEMLKITFMKGDDYDVDRYGNRLYWIDI